MRSRFLVATILGVSLIVSSAVFGLFFYQSRLPQKTIRVVGAATQRFDSDIVKWRVTLSRNVGPDGLAAGSAQIGKDLASFVALLKANGLSEKDLTVQPVNVNPMFSQGGGLSGYTIMQNLFLVSGDIEEVEELALNPGSLSGRGIVLQSSNLEYYCSRLSEIKKSLLAKATGDARRRGDEIAKSTGDRIAKIDSARVGVFQITEPFSTEVSDYGIYSTSTRKKDITVTVSVVFRLK